MLNRIEQCLILAKAVQKYYNYKAWACNINCNISALDVTVDSVLKGSRANE